MPPSTSLNAIVVSVVGLLSLGSAHGACFPTSPKDPSDVYELVSSAIDTFAYVDSGLKASTDGGDSGRAFEAIYGMKVAEAEFSCAASTIEPFTKSKRERAQMVAAALHLAYSSEVANTRELIEIVTSEQPSSADLNRASDLLVAGKGNWVLVLQSSAMLTHTLVNYEASSRQDAPIVETTPLAITHEQRRELMRKLTRLFGQSVRHEPTGGNSTGLTSAQFLYKALNDAAAMRDKDGSRI